MSALWASLGPRLLGDSGVDLSHVQALLQSSADAYPEDEAVEKMRLELGRALQTRSGEQKVNTFVATFVKLASKLAKSEALTEDEKVELSTSISEAAGVDIPHQDAQERLEASMETLLGLIPACIPDQLPRATWLHATLKSAVRWANDEMWNEVPQVEALLTVTHSIEVFKDGSKALSDVPLMVSKDTKWERRSVETCKHITSDGCFLGDKVAQVLAEGEKLVKSAEDTSL